MLTRLLILFISNLVKTPRHPKDKVWKLSCKLVPLKSKQTMNPWSNYTRNFPAFQQTFCLPYNNYKLLN